MPVSGQSGTSGASTGLYAEVTYISGVVFFAGAVITLSLLASVAAYVLYARHEFSPGWFTLVADMWRHGGQPGGSTTGPNGSPDGCGSPAPGARRATPDKLVWWDEESCRGHKGGPALAARLTSGLRRACRMGRAKKTLSNPAPCIIVSDDSEQLLADTQHQLHMQQLDDGAVQQLHKNAVAPTPAPAALPQSLSYDNGSFGARSKGGSVQSGSNFSMSMSTHARLVETTDEIFV